jgi:hypothetical protein
VIFSGRRGEDYHRGRDARAAVTNFCSLQSIRAPKQIPDSAIRSFLVRTLEISAIEDFSNQGFAE